MAEARNTMERHLFNAAPLLMRTGVVGSLWRHRLMFVVIFLAIVLLSLVTAILLPARYLATGMVIVAEGDPATRTSDVWAQKQGDPADLESQIMILRSSRLMKLALSQPGALEAAMEVCSSSSAGCESLRNDTAQLADKVADRYSVGAVGRSRVLSISYTSASPDNAMTMANALVTAYLNDQRGTESNSREVAAKWLWQEVTDLDKEIRDQVAKIESFRRQNGLVQGATASISSESLTSASQQLAAAEQAKAQAQARLDAIRDMKNGRDASASQMALDSRTVADLKQQIATVGNQLAASSAVLGTLHPQRRMLEASLSLLKQQLANEIDRISVSAQKDFETASNLVTTLRKEVDKAKDNAANARTDESSIEGMVRDVEAKRQLYAQLYQRASELESERRSLTGGTRLVSLAEKPTLPYFPKKTPMVAAGLALGLFLAAASCVLWDRIRNGFGQLDHEHDASEPRRDDDVLKPEPLAVIGSLPDLPAIGLAGGAGDDLLAILRRSMCAVGFQQGAKEFATDLFDASAGRPLLVLPAEGGSRDAAFLTLAAGQVLAKKGHNVLAVECGSAAREFADAFKLPNREPTLCDVMTGAARLPAGISRTSTPGFHVMAGDNETLGLLESGDIAGLETLIGWAKVYDLVLFTGPALLDPRSHEALRSLAEMELGTVVCIDRGDTQETLRANAETTLARLGLRSAGAVLMPALGKDDRAMRAFTRGRKAT